jgi:hypothetical protein
MIARHRRPLFSRQPTSRLSTIIRATGRFGAKIKEFGQPIMWIERSMWREGSIGDQN